MAEIKNLLMALINAAVFSVQPEKEDFSSLSAEDWESICNLATRHNLGHLVGEAVAKYALTKDEELKAALSRKTVTAMQRYYALENELATIKDVLEKQKIPYLPLKGAVMRQYYPKPWLRTSCDVDILVQEEDLLNAAAALQERGFTFNPKSSHDIGGESPNGIHIELHYTLIEDGMVSEAAKPTENIWSHTVRTGDDSYCHRLSDEMFYYYHIAHMAKHFTHGGCGIRPIMDLYVLKKANHIGNRETVDDFLRLGGLEKFAAAVEKLSRVWFEGEAHDEITAQVEDYLLCGGVYGTVKNHISVQQVTKGSRRRYILSRIWLPYETMKKRNPSIEGHRNLLLFYEIGRWLSLPFGGRLKHSVNELKTSSSVTKEQLNETENMLNAVGLTE